MQCMRPHSYHSPPDYSILIMVPIKSDTSLGYLLGESGAPNRAQGGVRATLAVIIDW